MDSLENIDFTRKSEKHYTLIGKHRRLLLSKDSYRRGKGLGGQVMGFLDEDNVQHYWMYLDLIDKELIAVVQQLIEKVSGESCATETFQIHAWFDIDTDPYKVPGSVLLVTELYKDEGEWCLRAKYIREQDEV